MPAGSMRLQGCGREAIVAFAAFLFLVHETPYFAIAVMRTLADRLRRSVP